MPDGDKFENRLRSKLWKQVYRLACNKIDSLELIRLIRQAVEQDRRGGLECPNLEEILGLLHKAQGDPLFAPVDAMDRESELAQQLDDIAASQTFHTGTRLAIEAAKSVYAEIESGQEAMTREQVQRMFSDRLMQRIIDHQFFAPVRRGMQEKTGLNDQEQRDRETRLTNSVISYREPIRRRQPQVNTTLERLHQPMQVIEA